MMLLDDCALHALLNSKPELVANGGVEATIHDAKAVRRTNHRFRGARARSHR